MRAHDKSLVVYTKILFACYFNGDLPEFLFDSCSAVIEVVVHILDVNHYELTHPVSAKNRTETMLPVCGFVNFEGLHCFHIQDVDRLGDFVNKNQGANASQLF